MTKKSKRSAETSQAYSAAMRPIGNFLGIDPGVAGGFAIISNEGITQVFSMPRTEGEISRLFDLRIRAARISFCLIEKVHAIPAGRDKEGKLIEGMSSTAMFSFGRNVGILTGLLLAHKIPFEEISPKDWQKALGISPRARARKKAKPFMPAITAESKSEWKNRLKGIAEKLFPEVTVTLSTADALLIAEVAQRIKVGYRGRAIR